VPDTLLGELFICSKKIIIALKDSLKCDFVHVVVEGVEVPHVHIHLIPSSLERKNAQWNHTSYEKGEKNKYAQKIKNALI
jgi:histidine triad (HIT) family protein